MFSFLHKCPYCVTPVQNVKTLATSATISPVDLRSFQPSTKTCLTLLACPALSAGAPCWASGFDSDSISTASVLGLSAEQEVGRQLAARLHSRLNSTLY